MNTKEKREAIYNLAKEVLAKTGANFETRLKADQLLEIAKRDYLEKWTQIGINEEYFGQYLSQAIKDKANSEIIRPEGSQGYFLVAINKDVATEILKIEKEEIKKEDEERKKENNLYPFFEKWLRENGYRSGDTSNNRSMGKWGNPDVTGIKILSDYGLNEIDVTTIEVKLNGLRWEYDIFEAVAHRRFANNVYFAFAVEEGAASAYSRNSKLGYYCSLYEIGALIITFSSEAYKSLISGKFDKSIIEKDEYDIIEIFPAKYHTIRLDYKSEYLESISVPKDHKMYSWGTPPID